MPRYDGGRDGREAARDSRTRTASTALGQRGHGWTPFRGGLVLEPTLPASRPRDGTSAVCSPCPLCGLLEALGIPQRPRQPRGEESVSGSPRTASRLPPRSLRLADGTGAGPRGEVGWASAVTRRVRRGSNMHTHSVCSDGAPARCPTDLVTGPPAPFPRPPINPRL